MRRGRLPEKVDDLRRTLCLQVSETVSGTAGHVQAATECLCRDLSATVAEYACEGVFSVQARHFAAILGAAGGHWWSISSDNCYVESSHFSGRVWIPTSTLLPEKTHISRFQRELLDGSLLLILSWKDLARRRVLASCIVDKNGTAAHLWVRKWDEFVWISEACLFGAGPTLELVVPYKSGFLVLDVLCGQTLRTKSVYPLAMQEHRVFQGHGDLVLLVSEVTVRVFSWQAQRYLAEWPNPMESVDDAFMVCGKFVHLIDTGRQCHATCSVLEGTVASLALYTLSVPRARHALGTINDWLPTRQIDNRLYSIM